jgi:hypothetical protein
MLSASLPCHGRLEHLSLSLQEKKAKVKATDTPSFSLNSQSQALAGSGSRVMSSAHAARKIISSFECWKSPAS